MMTKSVTISSKYQITIPKRIADQYGLGPGRKIYLEDTEKGIQIRPVKMKKMNAEALIKKYKNRKTSKRLLKNNEDIIGRAITEEWK